MPGVDTEHGLDRQLDSVSKRLFTQIHGIMKINELRTNTLEVIEAARSTLVSAPNSPVRSTPISAGGHTFTDQRPTATLPKMFRSPSWGNLGFTWGG